MSHHHELYQDLPKGELLKMSLFINFFFTKYSIIIQQGLNPGKAIAEIKKLLSGMIKKDAPGLETAALHK